jgi:hypothetical protein
MATSINAIVTTISHHGTVPRPMRAIINQGVQKGTNDSTFVKVSSGLKTAYWGASNNQQDIQVAIFHLILQAAHISRRVTAQSIRCAAAGICSIQFGVDVRDQRRLSQARNRSSGIHDGDMGLGAGRNLVGLCIVEMDGDTIPVCIALTRAVCKKKTVCT